MRLEPIHNLTCEDWPTCLITSSKLRVMSRYLVFNVKSVHNHELFAKIKDSVAGNEKILGTQDFTRFANAPFFHSISIKFNFQISQLKKKLSTAGKL